MAKRQEEQEQFVVSDKRKFTSEGELRPEAQEDEAAAPAQPAPPSASSQTVVVGAAAPNTTATEAPSEFDHTSETMPAPPSAAEQKTQNDEYHKAGLQIDSMLDAAGTERPPDAEMNFERLTASLYMQAMMQLGMLREENATPQPDLVGARQTIDTIALLQEKTKGNLTERESHMLQNCLFELRMAFLEITNILTRPPGPGAMPGAPGFSAGGSKS